MSVKDTVKGIYDLSINHFFNSVNETVKLLTFSLDENANVISIVENVSNLLTGVALTVISFLFIIDLLENVLMKMEDLRYEDIVKVIMKMLFAKMFSSYMSLLILGIYGKVTDIILKITVTTKPFTDLAKEITSNVQIEGGFLDASIFLICNIFPIIVLQLAGIIIKVMAYARMFEFFVLVAISPIASSFLPYKGTADITKKFILNVVSVLLQGLVMLISIQIYAKLLTSFTLDVSSVTALLLQTTTLSCVLLMAITSSGKWAKQVVGLN